MTPSGHAGSVNAVSADAPYSERLWVPAWTHVAVFAPSWLFLAVIGWFATNDRWLIVGVATGFALWMELLIVGSTTGRRIRRDGIWLRVGFGEKLDLRWVQSVEVVHGRETDAIRHRLLNPSQPPAAATAVAAAGGSAGLAVGDLALAWSTLRGLRSRRGMLCPSGVHDAVHVVNMPGQTADEWLIASRDPEHLAATIRAGVAEAQAAVRAASDPV